VSAAGQAGDGHALPDWLVAILVCPVTRTPLVHLADEGLLVSEKAGLAYPVIDGVPHLIAEEARPWPAAGDTPA
jgi:uncharacterized protein YbaR (Trm112 family)